MLEMIPCIEQPIQFLTLGLAGYLGLGDYKPATGPGPILHPNTVPITRSLYTKK